MNKENLKISYRTVADATIVDLEGRIDITNSTTLRSSLFETLKAAPWVGLNMSGIRYIDSSGIATLIEALKRARALNRSFCLFGVGKPVHDVLKLTNLLGVFQIFESEKEALEKHG